MSLVEEVGPPHLESVDQSDSIICHLTALSGFIRGIHGIEGRPGIVVFRGEPAKKGEGWKTVVAALSSSTSSAGSPPYISEAIWQAQLTSLRVAAESAATRSRRSGRQLGSGHSSTVA